MQLGIVFDQGNRCLVISDRLIANEPNTDNITNAHHSPIKKCLQY